MRIQQWLFTIALNFMCWQAYSMREKKRGSSIDNISKSFTNLREKKMRMKFKFKFFYSKLPLRTCKMFFRSKVYYGNKGSKYENGIASMLDWPSESMASDPKSMASGPKFQWPTFSMHPTFLNTIHWFRFSFHRFGTRCHWNVWKE